MLTTACERRSGIGTGVGYGEDCLPPLLAKGQVLPSPSSPAEAIYGSRWCREHSEPCLNQSFVGTWANTEPTLLV